MQCICLIFRIAVNTNKEKIMEILKKHNNICMVALEEQKFVIGKNNVEIKYNEDYDKKLSIVDEDKYLYYKYNIDFYPDNDLITLENQIQLAKDISEIFDNYGVASEIIAEFEELL